MASAVVAGRIDETTPPSGGDPDPELALVGEVRGDGTLETLGQAEVESTGDFRLEEVPASRVDLVVVIRNEGGFDIGSSLVHGEVPGDGEVRVAPIGPATTARARVHARLHSSGRVLASRSSGELALLLHFDDESARTVATSQAQIDAVADAYAGASAAVTDVLAELGAPAALAARSEVYGPAAAAYADALDGGTDRSTAYDAFVVATVDGLVESGIPAPALALATAAGATALATVGGEAAVDPAARTDAVRSVAGFNLLVRQRLADAVDAASPLRDRAVSLAADLSAARAAVVDAVDVAEIQAELAAVFSNAGASLTDGVTALASDLSGSEMEALEASLVDATGSADLAAALEGSSGSAALAGASRAYLAGVEAAVAGVLDALAPSGASLSTDTLVSLLLAAGSNGALS